MNEDFGAGSFAVTGQAAPLNVSASLATGSFAVSGQENSMIAGKGLQSEAGSFAVTGQDVTPVIDVSAILNHGSFAVTGQAAFGLVGEIFETGGFNLTGQTSSKKQCD